MYRYVTIILIIVVSLMMTACEGVSSETPQEPAADLDVVAEEATEESAVEAVEEASAAISEDVSAAAETNTPAAAPPMDKAIAVINPDYFDAVGQVSAPQVMDCTLQNGLATQCVQFVSKYLPDNLEIGPFCPDTIFEEGGIWEWDGDNPGLYRLNEVFFTMLKAQGYEFYDADGNVYIGDPAGAIQAGVNNCLEATADETVEITVRIPLQPIRAETPTDLGTVAQVGLGIDGVPIFADAPSVLQTGHLPALDECGGHIDPGGWYHWHATASDIDSSLDHEGVDTDCHLDQSAAALFGYAFDGYPIYGSVDQDGSSPTDLDQCSGHTGPTAEYPEGVYHYHAGLDFPNLPTCLVGVSADNAFATTASAGIGAAGFRGPGGPGGGPPDFAAVAAELGITEEEFTAALGPPPPNLEATADALGITLAELQAALDAAGVQLGRP